MHCSHHRCLPVADKQELEGLDAFESAAAVAVEKDHVQELVHCKREQLETVPELSHHQKDLPMLEQEMHEEHWDRKENTPLKSD